MVKQATWVFWILFFLFRASLSDAHTFSTTTVDDQVDIGGNVTSVAFDGAGRVGVCYYNSRTRALQYAFSNNDVWSTEVADSQPGKTVGTFCAIVFDGAHRPNILYHNTTDSELRHARKMEAGWVVTTVDDRVTNGWFSQHRLSVAKKSNGDIGVAYYDSRNTELRYAVYARGRWTTEVVTAQGDAGRFPALDYNASDRPAIAYMLYTNDSSSSAMLIEHDGNAWKVPEVVHATDASGYYNAFQYDSQGVVHLAFQRKEGRHWTTLQYLRRDGNRWSNPEMVDGSMLDAGGFAQMVIGPADDIHLLYRLYFRSALFPPVNYLRLYSIHFPSQGMGGTSVRLENVAVHAAFPYDMAGLSIAIDNAYRLVMAYAADTFERRYVLKVSRLTAWSPVILPLQPDAVNNTAVDSFDMSWLDFDPDSNASIRIYARDANFAYTLLEEGIFENGLNETTLDVAALPRGEYAIEARISDDDFVRYNGGGARTNLTIQNHPPRVPVPAAPADRAESATARPVIRWDNTTDLDGDALRYIVELSTDNTFAAVHWTSDPVVQDNSGATIWNVQDDLADDTTYYWRVRARDNAGGDGEWSVVRTFTTNVNDAPTAPIPSRPEETTTDDTPALAFVNAADADGQPVVYTVQVCGDHACNAVLQTLPNIPGEQGGTTHVEIPRALVAGAYFWRVRGTDSQQLDGHWSAIAALNIVLAADAGGGSGAGAGGGGSAAGGGAAGAGGGVGASGPSDPNGSGLAGAPAHAGGAKSGGCTLLPLP